MLAGVRGVDELVEDEEPGGGGVTDSFGCLVCPACGHNHLHHGAVVINNRASEDQPGVVVEVAGQAMTAHPSLPADFAGRRNDLRIAMSCEQCGPIGELVIRQHKGSTYIEWKKYP